MIYNDTVSARIESFSKIWIFHWLRRFHARMFHWLRRFNARIFHMRVDWAKVAESVSVIVSGSSRVRNKAFLCIEINILFWYIYYKFTGFWKGDLWSFARCEFPTFVQIISECFFEWR
jgi:hypothetical protein